MLANSRFGDFFHEIPELESFYLECGAEVQSFCPVNLDAGDWALNVIPRAQTEDALEALCPGPNTSYSFRINGERLELAQVMVISDSEAICLAHIDPLTVPRALL